MKFKTTKKVMKDNYYYIVGTGYCNMSYLLYYEKPIAYSSGTYGWSCDYYEIDNVLISTGYNHLKNKNTTVDYETINKYDKLAMDIINNHSIHYEEQKEKVKNLLQQFIKEVKQWKTWKKIFI